jgi:hypothetical protein
MINGKTTQSSDDIRTQITREHINVIDDNKTQKKFEQLSSQILNLESMIKQIHNNQNQNNNWQRNTNNRNFQNNYQNNAKPHQNNSYRNNYNNNANQTNFRNFQRNSFQNDNPIFANLKVELLVNTAIDSVIPA